MMTLRLPHPKQQININKQMYLLMKENEADTRSFMMMMMPDFRFTKTVSM